MAKLDYKQFEDYAFSLVHAIPDDVYEGIASIFCLGLMAFIAWKGFRTEFRYSAALLLIEYVFLIFSSTVIFRTTGETRRYDFHPFWSYSRPELMVENIMNVVVFVPVGLLLGIAFKDIRWLQVLLIGCLISVSIEVLQFFFKRGFSEFDDVFHNVIGCLIGYGIYSAWCWGRRWSMRER